MYSPPLDRSGQPVRDANGPRYQLGVSWPAFFTSSEYAALSELRMQTMDLLAAQASITLARDIVDVVVRDIQPNTDLGNATYDFWGGVSLVANTWTHYINKALSGIQQLYAFFGVADITANPKVRSIRFWRGAAATQLGQYEIEAMYAFSNGAMAIIRPSMIFFPNDTIQLDALTDVTQSDVLVPLGFCAEQYGVHVNPPRA